MIEILCGTIASGKSTYASQKAKEGWIVINDDAIVLGVHGGNYTYKEELKAFYKSIETHILHMAIALGKNVIVDRGINLTKNSRKRWIALAKSLDTPINAIIFPFASPQTHAHRRFNSNSRGLSYEKWEKIATRHIESYQPPTMDEGFDSIRSENYEHS